MLRGACNTLRRSIGVPVPVLAFMALYADAGMGPIMTPVCFNKLQKQFN